MFVCHVSKANGLSTFGNHMPLIADPTSNSTRLAVECISHESGFRALEPCWNKLLQQSDSGTVFLTWEWLQTWFKYLSAGQSLHVLRVSSGEETLALAPLLLQPRTVDRILGVQSVGFLGAGKAGADHLDFLIRRDSEPQTLAALRSYIQDRRLMLTLANIRQDCAASRWAAQMKDHNWRSFDAKTNICPFVRLTGHSWESYLDSLGSEHRYHVRRKLRSLSRNFDVQLVRVATEEQRRDALALLIEFHNRRWKGLSCAFNTPSLVSFHDEFTRLALAKDWLRLYVLQLNGRPVAWLYGLRYNDVFYFYQSAFDMEGYGKHSVGLALMALTIKASIEEGVQEFDLLRGEEQYKFHWANAVRETGQVYLCPQSTIGAVYQGAAQFKLNLGRLARRVLTDTVADAIAVRIRTRGTHTADSTAHVT